MNVKMTIVVLGDLIIIPLSYAGAYLIRFSDTAGFREKFPGVLLIIMTLAYLSVFHLLDLYSLSRPYDLKRLFRQTGLAVVLAAVVVSLLKYALFLLPIGRGILVIASAMILLLIFAWRIVSSHLFRILGAPRRVVLIGASDDMRDIVREISSRPQEFQIAAVLEDAASAAAGLRTLAEKRSADLIVLAVDPADVPSLPETLMKVRLTGTEVAGFTDFYQQLKERIPLGGIRDESWFLETRGFSAMRNTAVVNIKRLMDAVISACLLLASLPLWPVIAAAVKLDSKGPVFYRQSRVGLNVNVFSVLKFRSMIAGAEDREPRWAEKNDERITRIGRVLRRFHLDELPQFWNVLRGEMSLVGPRPERPEFVETLKGRIPFYSLRHIVKPGLTGWAQINYPYAASLESSRVKLEYDLYYIAHWSPALDLKILARTARAMIIGRKDRGQAAE